MASEDKTYCGRSVNSIPADDPEIIRSLIGDLGVTEEDIFNAIRIVGNDKNKVEDYFRSKESSY